MKDQMLFGNKIDLYFDDILKDLAELIAIPSVCDAGAKGIPFGQPCADALDFILRTAEKLGLSVENVDGYAGEARLGEGEDYVDVLTHVDVVPAGDGWDTDPFEMIQKGNRLFGRGTADDKGSAVAALYALKALKDEHITGNYCLRAVFGCGEEIASEDLDVYYKRRGFPVMGFTPDCAYGICSSEKGILRVDFTALRTEKSVIRHIHAGNAVNAVPNQALAEIEWNPGKYELLVQSTQERPDFTVTKEGTSIHLTCTGKAAHGAEPELGENAASKLLCLLYQVFTPDELGPLFTFAAEKIKMEYTGASLGIQMKDDESGPLTFNLGMISYDNGKEKISVDIRYPVTAHKEQILSLLETACQSYKIEFTEANHMAPLHVPSDSLLVSVLSDAYEAVTGKTCNIYSTGGGTYARHANNAVAAFGPAFPDEPSSNAHGPNEFIDLDYYRLHCRVCLEAMYRLFTAPGQD
ncbi:Sapep family Mn(2+)-dependent dipeptidase [Faecalicatena sp. AGMB00832]|uniref:Sapep family Mn(2+)-dependent dipeptidase n=1 Tax=Faecalicatena faecalis TaxID=2726362 RepID=A0ABS6D3Q6_9FIRM|nr:Sapep family Mn(2+)-dependent dipeptidase [Faecalicatena faecalis]MBU3876219.1 Sapep family Mn(2+)-dependent dipeptidase [Faecalicatena faecalis]